MSEFEYKTVQIDVVKFEGEDVIVTSGCDGAYVPACQPDNPGE